MNRKSIFILALVLLLVLVGVTSCESGMDASKQEMEVLKKVLDKATFVPTTKMFPKLKEFDTTYTMKEDETLKPIGSDIVEITIKNNSNYNLHYKGELKDNNVSIEASVKIDLHITYKLKGSEKPEQLNINGKFSINGAINFDKIADFTNEDFKKLFNVSSKVNINNKKINVNKDFVQLFNLISFPTP